MIRIGLISGMFLLCCLSMLSQQADSLKIESLEEVIIQQSVRHTINRNASIHLDLLETTFLQDNFTGNLIQTLEQVPGIRSMDIGMGASKPMIRGMAFNRVSVVENGIKQEGQQWGVDHGLEMDPFDVEKVIIHKGPASLFYGSDAMGGVIEIQKNPSPSGNQLSGEVWFFGKSVNETLGISAMMGIKKNVWYSQIRFSEQYFGDYRVPVDTVVYLTQHLPLYGRKLKNTAGMERNISFYSEYKKGSYLNRFYISNVYQKTGFFPGAHGIPDVDRVQDDGDSRNIELPYSKVNHFKISDSWKYIRDNWIGLLDIGYQYNLREEWSQFHTHYGTQQPPVKNPDKELQFSLHTFSGLAKVKGELMDNWGYAMGLDMQFQRNTTGGYSFLLPEYERFTSGAFIYITYRSDNTFFLNGGIRYDYGEVRTKAYEDPYLVTYLMEKGYDDTFIEEYRWRSYPVNRSFGNVSGSFGINWTPLKEHMFKLNIGRSFRLPGANELASNGVHHSAFRHEQGDASLSSEQG